MCRTATAAAGVEIFISQSSTDSKADESVVINFGYAAKLVEGKINKIIINKKQIKLI